MFFQIKRIFKPAKYNLFLILFFAVVAFIYVFPIFQQINNWGIQDWDQHLFYHGVPRVTLLEYGQIPLWNPYYVGGTVMLANPQSRLLAPFFFLHLVFGEVIGIKIEIWLHLLIGLLGSYVLARHYKLDRLAAMMAAFVFMLSSMAALTLTVGMTWFLAVAYLPWTFLFYLKALSNFRYALAGGFCLVLMFFGGGVYPLAITLLFLGIYSLLLIILREQPILRMTKLLGIIFIFMLCLGAIKFFPTIEFLQAHPRRVYDYSGYSLNALRFSLFNRDQSLDAITNLSIEAPGFLNGVTGGMDENGMYIGLIPFVLFILGLNLNDKRRFFLFVCMLIFLWISLGNRPKAELWSILHLFPVYNSMRLAQRFRIIFMLCLAIFTGFGFQTFRQYTARFSPNRTVSQSISFIVLLAVLVDLLLVGSSIFKDAFPIPPQEIVKSDVFYQVWDFPSYNEKGPVMARYDEQPSDLYEAYTNPDIIHASFGSLYPTFLSNIGTINGYESANVPRNATPVSVDNYQGEVYLKDTTGTVTVSDWSPNRLLIEVDVAEAGYVVINQNYYDGWHVAGVANRGVESVNQLLAVQIYPDDDTIELYYRPASFVWGAVVTLITILLSLGYGGWRLWQTQSHLLRRDNLR